MILRGKDDLSISSLRRSALLDPVLMRQLRRTLIDGSLISVGSMNDVQLLDALEHWLEADRVGSELLTELLRSVPEPAGGGSVPVVALDTAEVVDETITHARPKPEEQSAKVDDTKPKVAAVSMKVADPAAVDVDRHSKGQKLALTIEIVEDGMKTPLKFDGKVILKTTGGGDRIKLLDGAGTVVTLPLTVSSGKVQPKMQFTVQGTKASDALDDVELEVKLEKTASMNVGSDGSAKAKLTVVDLRAEDGKADPPRVVAVKNDITSSAATHKVKIKAIPDLGGKWNWTTTSSKLTIEDANKQTAVIVAKSKPSGTAVAETIKLEAAAPGRKSITLNHKIGGAEVIFEQDPSHEGGYDKYETIAGLDGNGDATSETPSPKHDIMCIEKSKEGKVKFTIKGATKDDIFFTSDSDSVAKPKTGQPAGVSGSLAIAAGAKNKKETILNARVGSKTGPIVAKLGVVVLKKVKYEAEFFRVKDTKSASTALSLGSITGTKLNNGAKKYYIQAISELKITGGAAEKDVPYDSTAGKSTNNGSLDLEPGKTSKEEKIIMAACISSKSRAIYVHDLRWSYYFRADASAGDLTIKLKRYGATYLGYIGTKTYKIADAAGNSENVTIKAVNTATGKVTITSGLTNSYKKSDGVALIWPLGGLSGDPVWVKDVGSEGDLTNYVVHELGHQLAGWSDLCETNNFMHGGSATGALLRHRPLKEYYNTSNTEKQWKDMNGR